MNSSMAFPSLVLLGAFHAPIEILILGVLSILFFLKIETKYVFGFLKIPENKTSKAACFISFV